MPHFDGFRLRWWSKLLPKPRPPGENGSDCSSSPERVERFVSLPLPASKNPRRSADQARNVHKTLGTPTPTTNKTKSSSRLSHDEVLNEKSSTHQPPVEATDKAVNLLRSTTNIHKSSPPAMKTSLVRRVTSKLRINVPATTSSSQAMSSAAPASHSRDEDEEKRFSRPPPRTTLRHSSTLPDSFVSRERREAALRERGLRPPRKDLSEQEREADERLGLAPLPEQGESSAASKIKEEWLSMNSSTEASDPGSAFYPQQLNFSALASGVAPLSHPVSQPLPRSWACDSDCTRADLETEIPLIGRASISNSISPLSQSSHLEVLQEEPADPPPLLRAQPPIVISTPVDDSFPLNSPRHVEISESPVSCTFSSRLAPPGSFPDKENSGSPFQMPPARRRTTNSSNRSHISVGTSLSKFGTGSLSNLRRSVVGSIRRSGSSADLSTSSSSQPSSPRMAVRPTIHNRASIMFETKGIEDAESRRLSELAFLD